MNELVTAADVIKILKAAERESAQVALSALNGLAGRVRAAPERPLEIEEARAGAFIAICEVAKALHRGMPAEQLWSSAIVAAERWRWLDDDRIG